MHRFCGTLSLNKDVQKAATCIAKKAVDLDIVPGRSPISVAAAAIYMASQVLKTQEIYQIGRCYKKFHNLNLSIKSNFLLSCRHQTTKDPRKKLRTSQVLLT